jgi:site-specific recombinase XerD
MKQAENIYLQKFSEWLLIKGHTGSTAKSYRRSANHFISWLCEQGIEAESVHHNDIVAYVSHQKQQGNKAHTLQCTVNAIRHFYNFLQQEEIIAENPALNVLIKGVKRKELVEILSPAELETIYKSFDAQSRSYETGKRMPPQQNNERARKRNKIMLGLMIYQGIRTAELAKLEVSDLDLREGKLTIQASGQSEERVLKLEAHQVYDLMDYVHTIRKELLASTLKDTRAVFISLGTGENLRSSTKYLLKCIQAKYPQLKNLQQIRTSVISNWLKVHNLRQVQYMAGHRYVSSTEAYQQNNIEELQDDIKKYHPIG